MGTPFVCLFVCLFVSRQGCPGTHFVDQAVLELRNLPASASGVLGLKACATTPGSWALLFMFVNNLLLLFFLLFVMLGMVVYAFIPSTWEAEAGGFLSSRPAEAT